MANPSVGCFIWDVSHKPDVVTTNSSDVGLDPTNSITSSGPRKLSQNVGATAWAWVCDYLGLPLPAVGRSTVSGGRFVIYTARLTPTHHAPPNTVSLPPFPKQPENLQTVRFMTHCQANVFAVDIFRRECIWQQHQYSVDGNRSFQSKYGIRYSKDVEQLQWSHVLVGRHGWCHL